MPSSHHLPLTTYCLQQYIRLATAYRLPTTNHSIPTLPTDPQHIRCISLFTYLFPATNSVPPTILAYHVPPPTYLPHHPPLTATRTTPYLLSTTCYPPPAITFDLLRTSDSPLSYPLRGVPLADYSPCTHPLPALVPPSTCPPTHHCSPCTAHDLLFTNGALPIPTSKHPQQPTTHPPLPHHLTALSPY